MKRGLHSAFAEWLEARCTYGTWLKAERLLAEFLQETEGCSAEQAAENAEVGIKSVIKSLHAQNLADANRGLIQKFEIRSDRLRILRTHNSKTRESIDQLSPDDFEHFCAALVEKLGGRSEKTGKAGDQGVDFFGDKIILNDSYTLMPAPARPILLGQAKHYTGKVREVEVREFVSGALLKAREYQLKNGLLCPVIFAFWTSSSLDEKAEEACTKFGIWHLDGTGLAMMAEKLQVDPNNAVDR